jgi:hypothetical protein
VSFPSDSAIRFPSYFHHILPSKARHLINPKAQLAGAWIGRITSAKREWDIPGGKDVGRQKGRAMIVSV